MGTSTQPEPGSGSVGSLICMFSAMSTFHHAAVVSCRERLHIRIEQSQLFRARDRWGHWLGSLYCPSNLISNNMVKLPELIEEEGAPAIAPSATVNSARIVLESCKDELGITTTS